MVPLSARRTDPGGWSCDEASRLTASHEARIAATTEAGGSGSTVMKLVTPAATGMAWAIFSGLPVIVVVSRMPCAGADERRSVPCTAL